MTTTRTELISSLIADLLPTSQLTVSEAELGRLAPDELRALLRALMNLWQPGPLDADFLRRQDTLLQAERDERGIVTIPDTQVAAEDPRICLWRGDITRLDVDGIVNAANNKLLGCFRPGHTCVDNAIHSAAGLQLRQACAELVPSPDYEEPTGNAQITPGFNLPARYVLHTVGPIVGGRGANRQQVAELIRQLYLMPESRPQFGAEVPRLLLHFHRGVRFPTITCRPHRCCRSSCLPGWATERLGLHHHLHSIHPG